MSLFFVLTLGVVVALLGYSLFIAAPVVWSLALDLWSWWHTMPVGDAILAPLAHFIEQPTALVLAPYWDLWGAAALLALGLALVLAALRYLPRYIAGDL
ncbi:MAG: hypothetical protein FJX56_00665 [Alphaproteobacteria bacterium]|nr:hypothetical protein [Alphaproteobacteria bacterium]